MSDAEDDIPELLGDLFRIVGYVKDERAIPTLSALASHPHDEIRAAVADALGETGATGVGMLLEAMLKDDNEDVRENAVKGLFRALPEDCYEILVPYVSPASANYDEPLAHLVMSSLQYDAEAIHRGWSGEATGASRDERWRGLAKELTEHKKLSEVAQGFLEAP